MSDFEHCQELDQNDQPFDEEMLPTQDFIEDINSSYNIEGPENARMNGNDSMYVPEQLFLQTKVKDKPFLDGEDFELGVLKQADVPLTLGKLWENVTSLPCIA